MAQRPNPYSFSTEDELDSVSNDRIPQKAQSVNNYNMQQGGNNSTLKIYRK